MINFESFLPDWKLRPIIENFLYEDNPYIDISSFVIPSRTVKAIITLKEKSILAGLPIAKFIFKFLKCKSTSDYSDGFSPMTIPTSILNVIGNSSDILIAERLVLNFLGKLSAIATTTAEARLILEKNLENKEILPIICGTRKTTPGLRLFEKYAIMVGGGDPHRFSLSDAIMLKNNHLKLFSSITEAIKTNKRYSSFVHKIEVETEDLSQAIEAAKAGADIIMLDNFSAGEITDAVLAIKKINKEILIEASGGINLSNLKEYANTGVNYISMGMLTHSIKNIDFSLKLVD